MHEHLCWDYLSGSEFLCSWPNFEPSSGLKAEANERQVTFLPSMQTGDLCETRARKTYDMCLECGKKEWTLLNKVWNGKADWLAAWNSLKSRESSPLALLLQEHLERPGSLLLGKKQRSYHIVFFMQTQASITWTQTKKDQETRLPQILLLSALGGRTRTVLQHCNLQSTKHGDLKWPWLKCPLLYKISHQKCPSQVLLIGQNPQGMGSHLHVSKFIYFNRNKKSDHVSGHDHHSWILIVTERLRNTSQG